jgi:hypothetical protein
LKPPAEGVPDAAREALRAEVKALELKAEQALIEALEALAPPAGAAPRPLLPALEAAASQWPTSAPRPLLERLSLTLS